MESQTLLNGLVAQSLRASIGSWINSPIYTNGSLAEWIDDVVDLACEARGTPKENKPLKMKEIINKSKRDSAEFMNKHLATSLIASWSLICVAMARVLTSKTLYSISKTVAQHRIF